jgi:hypothetical protein
LLGLVQGLVGASEDLVGSLLAVHSATPADGVCARGWRPEPVDDLHGPVKGRGSSSATVSGVRARHDQQEQRDRAEPDRRCVVPLCCHAWASSKVGASSETPVSSDRRQRVSRRGSCAARWDSAAIDGCGAAAPNST